MKFHVLTIFPEFFRGPFEHGVVARARQSGRVEIRIHDLRDWTFDRHRTVDDRPFGGAEGMVLKADPVFRAVESLFPERDASRRRVLVLSASGRKFNQRDARRLSGLEEVLLVCGRYEGIDERVAEHLADEEISIGDYVLSGGELAAAIVVDTVARLLDGVLGNQASSVRESFRDEVETAALDCPQYTRPAEYRGWRVPEALVAGNHAEIERWRRQAARDKTARNRPDLLDRVPPQ
jgi:tRNA (guanine37-N1)-methyltransferase